MAGKHKLATYLQFLKGKTKLYTYYTYTCIVMLMIDFGITNHAYSLHYQLQCIVLQYICMEGKAAMYVKSASQL